MNKSNTANDSIDVLKTNTCDSLSRKSTLTYHLGVDSNSTHHIRIHANDGGGMFSEEWIALKDVLKILKAIPKDGSVTTFKLQSLFNGKSVNTPAFLLAALLHLKVLRTQKGKQRLHEVVDPYEFMNRIKKLNKPKAVKKTAKKAPSKKASKKAAGNKATSIK